MNLTAEQKASVLYSYNAAKKDAEFALDKVEFYAGSQRTAADADHLRRAKTWEAMYDSRHSFSLGLMAGIDHTLELLGLTLLIDDEDKAVDIEEEEG